MAQKYNEQFISNARVLCFMRYIAGFGAGTEYNKNRKSSTLQNTCKMKSRNSGLS
jgi:hypothetical protein